MSDERRTEGKLDEAKGTVKDTAGRATGDDERRAEGQVDQAKGQAKQGLADAKDAAQEAGDKIGDKLNR
jgi:uncharacterized protein YjbJ (UPF0337 family)